MSGTFLRNRGQPLLVVADPAVWFLNSNTSIKAPPLPRGGGLQAGGVIQNSLRPLPKPLGRLIGQPLVAFGIDRRRTHIRMPQRRPGTFIAHFLPHLRRRRIP